MRCPKLKELPRPPSDKTGWPWTEESPQLPDRMPDGSLWPKISIVTPSLNQGQFIEETIRSVLLQGYPDFEYIIIDGGSTDRSVEVIKKYEKWLTYWVSEPDKGQSHAINKGFAKATGEIYAYINSDDLYERNAFGVVAPIFSKSDKPQLVAGECIIFDGSIDKWIFKPWWPQNLSYFISKTYSSTFGQPSSFWSKKIFDEVGGFDESLHYCFDREFFLRVGLTDVSPHFIPARIARFRKHSKSKSINQEIRFHEESISITRKYASACGVSDKGQKQMINGITKEMAYRKVFMIWKEKGRKKASEQFIRMIMRYPTAVGERRVLGQLKRLLLFREKDVQEIH